MKETDKWQTNSDTADKHMTRDQTKRNLSQATVPNSLHSRGLEKQCSKVKENIKMLYAFLLATCHSQMVTLCQQILADIKLKGKL